MDELRVLHYINQFFAGLGGEAQADIRPRLEAGPVGPGRLLEQLLGSGGRIVGTLICGDDAFARDPEGCLAALAALASATQAHVLVAGPAFNAGRYGLACGRVCTELAPQLRIPSVTAMFPENPGVQLYRRRAFIIPVDETTVGMRAALEKLAGFSRRLADGWRPQVPDQDGYLSQGRRVNVAMAQPAAERAVEMLVAKLQGASWTSEIPAASSDGWHAAPPVPDVRSAHLALVTEGGVVPRGNPDRIESRRATRWRKYPIAGLDHLSSEAYECIHGGFDIAWVNRDPHRVLPLDVVRELESERRIGQLDSHYYVTVGCGTTIETAHRFGREMAEDLLKQGVTGVIMTAT
jgi:betaine reductase